MKLFPTYEGNRPSGLGGDSEQTDRQTDKQTDKQTDRCSSYKGPNLEDLANNKIKII